MYRVLLLAVCLSPLSAQRGDRAGESQAQLPAEVVGPPAPVLDVAAALGAFRLADGFTITPYASEPLVGDPVAAAFDAAGRLWVVEMRGYMRDLEATGEREGTGRIVVLADTDRDGRADASQVFADGLPLPRAVLPLRGGALVVAPPELLWLSDQDGDLRADGRTVLCEGFAAGLDNPEHAGNGLLWGLDHRIHLANDQRMVRWTPAGFAIEMGAGGGQWGITQDDRGRLYFNYNEDWLRCDLVPGRHGPRASAVGGLPALNHRVCRDTDVFPIRRTPGVNRGYQPGRLVDWVLNIHTAVCAPHVYRGGALPGCDGDVFVCEPAGNLVRRIAVEDHDAVLRGRNAYAAQRAEFLASTDERFRPVNLLTGPDGALYVVDMYRGVIQHKNFVTTFLRRQIEARQLSQPIGLGRIWRITAKEGGSGQAPVDLAQATAPGLVDALASANGALRDLALREIVQRQLVGSADAARARLRDDARPAARIVLLSVLAGLDRLTATDLRRAMLDPDPGVVAFALQHCAPFLLRGDGHLWQAIEQPGLAATPTVAWHLALLLGDLLAAKGADRVQERGRARLVALLLAHGEDSHLRAAVATAAQAQHLVPVLVAYAANLPQDAAAIARQRSVVRDLAARVVKVRRAACTDALLGWVEHADPRLQLDVLEGACSALPRGAARTGWLPLQNAEPLSRLSVGPVPAVAAAATELRMAVVVEGAKAPAAVTALAPAEQARVRAGETQFARVCAACHQLDGGGMAGLAPPLRDSEWVLGPPSRLVRIALHGVKGPIEVGGTTWTLEMPGQGHLGDDDLAAVLSYVRRAFGHAESTLLPAEVAAERARWPGRAEPWLASELLDGK